MKQTPKPNTPHFHGHAVNNRFFPLSSYKLHGLAFDPGVIKI